MSCQLNADKDETREPPGGPLRWPESGNAPLGQAHAGGKTGAPNEPHADASPNLHGARDGKARAQPIEEPYFDPMASERGPEHQQGGQRPTGRSAPPSSQDSAKN